MVVGFNHNFRYQGEVYHVQTEDSGIKNPHIITLLYRGGTILASKKTSYADSAKVDNLDQVVEDLMKEQHKEMLRRLKDGEFDEVIKGNRPAGRAATPPPAVEPAPATTGASVAAPAPVAPVANPAKPMAPAAVAPVPPRPAPVAASASAPSPVTRPAAAPPTPPAPETPPAKKPAEKPPELSLDDVILSYLVGDDK